jgi:hypothetical protein
MKKQQKSKSSNKLEDWYSMVPKDLLQNVPNGNYDAHLVSMPCRILIIGASGAGKTRTVLSLIYRMKKTFSHIVLCCMNASEPLYKYLAQKLDDEDLTICEGEDNIVSYDDLPQGDDEHTLVVYDDLCLAKNQSKIKDMFIRGRKKPASIIYCSQSYFSIPKVCRLNSTHVILRKLSTMRDLRLILSDYELDLTREQLLDMYNECTADNESFLMIDVIGPPETRFRRNFLENITPSTNGNLQSPT